MIESPSKFRQFQYPIDRVVAGPARRTQGESLNADLDARLDRVAALGEPARRALYLYVAAQPDPVSREQAADGVGVAFHTAKFHLDHLVRAGLLEAEYRRAPGRGGPGAGRPAKLYRPAEVDVEVSLPQRRYDLAGRLLVRAVAREGGADAPVADTLRQVAHEEGREVGAAAAGSIGPGRRPRQVLDAVVGLLDAHGFEPRLGRDGVALSNCPFHLLAQEARDLVCGMNLAFLEGLLDGIGAANLDAKLDPAPGRCCVRIRRA
jgi:predicted ArsR family transcriptional regulator